MIIRKISRNGIVSVRKLIKRGIIIVVLLTIIRGVSYVFTNQNDKNSISVAQIGNEITIDGYLTPDNNFPHYTHSITDVTKNKLGLKSASVNLNKYSGQVEVIGKVEKFLKIIPIVEVTTIKLPDQRVVIKNNTYYFADDFFLFDFSAQPQLSAIKSGNQIIVLFEGEPVVQIERFLCGKVLKGKNCTTLIDDYAKNGRDNFYSLRGYNFYKHNANTWVVFEGESFGYLFKNIEDDMMLNLSNMIKLVNKDFVLANKSKDIWRICSSTIDPMQKILSSKIKYSTNGSITLTINGETKEKNTVDCSLMFDPWTQWSIKKLSAIK